MSDKNITSTSFPVSNETLTSTLAPLPGDESPLDPREALSLRNLIARAPDDFVASVLTYAAAHGGQLGRIAVDVTHARDTLAWVGAAKEAMAQLEVTKQRLKRESLRRRASLSREVLSAVSALEAQARTDAGVELRDHAERLRSLAPRSRPRRKAAAKPIVPPAAQGGGAG